MNRDSHEISGQTEELPVVGITMGDAAGIGPEVILKALAGDELRKICVPVIIGDLSFLKAAAVKLGLSWIWSIFPKSLPPKPVKRLFSISQILADEVTTGVESALTGRASAQYIEAAVNLWREKKIEAIATAPISKAALALGGYDFPGHTEFLAYLTNTEKFAMSFFAEKLRVILLSTHVSLRRAIELVTKPALVDLISFSSAELSKLLGRQAKIAVAGLNPHASEGGMFGGEEAAEIEPAVRECREKLGLDVYGPFSPDTIFSARFPGRVRRRCRVLSRPGDDRRKIIVVRRIGKCDPRAALDQDVR